MEEPKDIPLSPVTEAPPSPADITQTAIATKPEPVVRRMFLGSDGLRSGWRLVIYLAAFLILLTLISLALRHFVPPPRGKVPPLWGFLLGEVVSLVAAILPAIAMSRFERRPFGAYGLPRAGAFGGRFWMGAVWGVVAFSVLIVVMRSIGIFSFGGLALHGAQLLKFAAFWAVLFLTVGLFEEFVTRGYTQFTLSLGIGFWPAAFLLSLAFGGFHLSNPGEGWRGAIGAALIGLFFCLTLRRTGNLWFAVGMHMSWDWSETYLYSVPDSGLVLPGHLLNSSFHGSIWLTGGTVGPEGSVLAFVLIGLMALVFSRAYPAIRPAADKHFFPTDERGSTQIS